MSEFIVEGKTVMQNFIKTLFAAATLALLVSCASTGETTGEEQTDAQQQDATAQDATAQPGQEAYSYAYGQAPSYDAYDTSGGAEGGGRAGGRPGQTAAGAASSNRVVYFNFDSSEILPESQAIIEANARALAGNRRAVTQLEGHTDERGSREYNIALGERRANAVRQVMIALGVSPQQIRLVSYGEERPAAGGQDEQSYALNRRVEIVY